MCDHHLGKFGASLECEDLSPLCYRTPIQIVRGIEVVFCESRFDKAVTSPRTPRRRTKRI